MDTREQFEQIMKECRTLFSKKLHDYGAAWRIMRPTSLTDQIYIKGIVNYAIIALIQLEKGFSDVCDMEAEEALAQYDRHAQEALNLMLRKNHDYDEAWRSMRVSSYTDLILMKIERVNEIEDHRGHTEISEGIDANYMDMINYAVFGIIKLTEQSREAEC